MAEFATVKSALPSVLTHSEALEFHSLFWTMYVPPPTEAVCELHSVVVAAWAAGPSAANTAGPPMAVSAATANGSMRLRPAFRPNMRDPPTWRGQLQTAAKH